MNLVGSKIGFLPILGQETQSFPPNKLCQFIYLDMNGEAVLGALELRAVAHI